MRTLNMLMGIIGLIGLAAMWPTGAGSKLLESIGREFGQSAAMLALVSWVMASMAMGVMAGDNIGRALFGRDEEQ